MATYLVTGAAGFIASRVCELLLEAGHTVVGIDNLNDYYDVRLKDWRLARLLGAGTFTPGPDAKTSVYAAALGALRGAARPGSGDFAFLPIDVENLPALEALFAQYRFDSVLHLAGRAGVRYSTVNPHVYLTSNTHGTLNILECTRKYGVNQMVLASTSSLYAGCPVPWSEELPVNTPLSPYAASKKGAEMMAYSYHHLYGINTTVLRFFTVYGPAGRPDMSPFRFIKWVAEDTPIEIYGDGTQSRDFTYVDDIARGTIAAIRLPGYEVINLGGGGNPITLLEMIKIVERLVGKSARLKFGAFNKADMLETQANISKARRLLGWEPRTGVEQGLRHCVDWYREQNAWARMIAT